MNFVDLVGKLRNELVQLCARVAQVFILEAQQAIAEGMSIYGGEIAFDDSVLAELAERVWDIMEEKDRKGFRRINTMLEE